MTQDQIVVFAVMAMTLPLFVWGRWRHDVVALLALLVLVAAGVVEGRNAFLGFSHPAVITVAAVLVISRGLRNAGVVDLVTRGLADCATRPGLQIVALCGTAAACSAFMNNVGALAIFMPVALEIASRNRRRPSWILMPLAFATILGGLITMIGTPPNIIIAAYRADLTGEPFGLFDFAPVGGVVAIAGVFFVATAGWRLLPRRRTSQAPADGLFRIDEYVTEVRVPPGSEWVGRRLAELLGAGGGEVDIAGLIRARRLRLAPSPKTRLRAGDVIILRADPVKLPVAVGGSTLEIVGRFERGAEALHAAGLDLMEAVVAPDSALVGRTPRALHHRSSATLLSVARQGRPIRRRLNRVHFRAGDVLLLHGPTASLLETIAAVGLLPLARRDLPIGRRRRPAFALFLFAAALAATATGVLPAAVAFTAVVVAYVLVGNISARELYESVDWSVIVLLGALLPVGGALQANGATELLARWLHAGAGGLELAMVIGIVMVATMALADLINNSATAVIMAPIAAGLASQLGLSPDPFLIAVSIGASSAFLTPLGHHCNTLVMGPGGYRFGDYWRMGLVLDVLIVAVAVPAIIAFWPPVPATPA